MSKKYFAGIGSRKTPNDVGKLMLEVGLMLKAIGYTLRSGAAKGADQFFERAYPDGDKEIYLPKAGFEHSSSKLYDLPNDTKARKIVEPTHPAWNRVNDFGKRLHTRNVYQVLGHSLIDPVDFVLCYTPDACEHHNTRTIDTGGTGTAITIATLRGIPVINMKRKNWDSRLFTLLSELENGGRINNIQPSEFDE